MIHFDFSCTVCRSTHKTIQQNHIPAFVRKSSLVMGKFPKIYKWEFILGVFTNLIPWLSACNIPNMDRSLAKNADLELYSDMLKAIVVAMINAGIILRSNHGKVQSNWFLENQCEIQVNWILLDVLWLIKFDEKSLNMMENGYFFVVNEHMLPISSALKFYGEKNGGAITFERHRKHICQKSQSTRDMSLIGP